MDVDEEYTLPIALFMLASLANVALGVSVLAVAWFAIGVAFAVVGVLSGGDADPIADLTRGT
ncbi:hypothetical protein AUR64_00920 [Haloprofundus marisrubri]|uniref:Uncharacterized protein n=1 Tax=Haloprofundus marisrubri TaxID=1514971 RepID=A0A0W1R4L5_9EURY|nr:hypothetical protein [Haloprofundus marisrubri]KTG08167.1 hypothetical protein AUR64_00920 [Haloprofundus marisrubri]